jgi:hypothetical protein
MKHLCLCHFGAFLISQLICLSSFSFHIELAVSCVYAPSYLQLTTVFVSCHACYRYKSYPPSVLVDLVARILALVPPWTRVYRVQRDIPMPLVTSGVEHGNLRELALVRDAAYCCSGGGGGRAGSCG